MCTSVIEKTKKNNERTAAVYAVASAVCLLFGVVYECFSNGVYSAFMLGAFALPLVLGAVPFFVMSRLRMANMPSVYGRQLYHSGVAALTVGAIVEGVLEIYGTTNHLVVYYLYGGALLIAAGVTAFVVDTICARQKKQIKSE